MPDEQNDDFGPELPEVDPAEEIASLRQRLGDIPERMAELVVYDRETRLPGEWPGLLGETAGPGSGDPLVTPPEATREDGLPEWAGFAQQQAFPPSPEQGLPLSAFPPPPFEEVVRMGFTDAAGKIGQGFDVIPWEHYHDIGLHTE